MPVTPGNLFNDANNVIRIGKDPERVWRPEKKDLNLSASK